MKSTTRHDCWWQVCNACSASHGKGRLSGIKLADSLGRQSAQPASHIIRIQKNMGNCWASNTMNYTGQWAKWVVRKCGRMRYCTLPKRLGKPPSILRVIMVLHILILTTNFNATGESLSCICCEFRTSTLMAFTKRLLPWKSNKYYIFFCVRARACVRNLRACVSIRWRVFVCVLVRACRVTYPACRAHARYCIVLCGLSGSDVLFYVIS